MLLPLLFLIAFLYGNWTDICYTVAQIYQDRTFYICFIVGVVVLGSFIVWLNSWTAAFFLIMTLAAVGGALY
jgi:hypothetical protein